MVRDRFDVLPIQPIYWQSSPNERIDLGAFVATLDDEKDETCGQAFVRFLPKESLELEIPAPAEESVIERMRAIFDPRNSSARLHLCSHKTTFDVFRSSTSSEKTVYHAHRTPMQVFKPSRGITRSVFHLFNWPSFRGPQDYVLTIGTPPRQGVKVCGRFYLEFDGWKITVADTDNTTESVKALRNTGGYAVTQVGMIERSDGRRFSTNQLNSVLAFLTYFFSLVLGQWRSPCLAFGFTETGERVFEEWGLRRCDGGYWEGWNSFFDEQHAELFTELVPGFWQLWSNKIWQKPLQEAIYWYLAGNRGGAGLGVDSAILFTQAALELLAWTYCVHDRKMISKRAFEPRGLSAADKLRLLASSLGIPLEIPSALSSLHLKAGKKWKDSMDVITEVRNSLVHPGAERKDFPDHAFFDAWRLSMWYLDVVMLRLCGYRGKYANRLTERMVGQVEQVPFSAT